jgi:(p)ppGpp synthase/HD superfamily hydrolase
MRAKDFAIRVHSSTNHNYDTYLPYEFHLRMVNKAALEFMEELEPGLFGVIVDSTWLHDTIEDCRVSYKDIKKNFGEHVAEIVRALTNVGRGRDREERMPDECYEDIKKVPGALFVKLCDRIANVQYSKMTGSRMFEVYKSEQEKFSEKLKDSRYPLMWAYLEDLLAKK